ncbi:MAG: CDP-alcohol phosphatidyltransferase family protein [Candidatus Coatesbacteria bacterium]|nr:MAG: CDP-alcohol phosphatidyltransferase family protein [Candidatus Coatesbacteria bacterium]
MKLLNDIGKGIGKYALAPPARLLGRLGLSPTVFTIVGLGVSAGAGVAFAAGSLRLGGLLVLLAGFFDMFDGVYARVNEKASRFGAFVDSTVDRYSESAYLTGLIYYYASLQNKDMALLTVLVLIGSVIVSYIKARAESLIESCKVGLMERPERMIVLAVGCLIGGWFVFGSLLLLAVLVHITAVQRIVFTGRRLRRTRKR